MFWISVTTCKSLHSLTRCPQGAGWEQSLSEVLPHTCDSSSYIRWSIQRARCRSSDARVFAYVVTPAPESLRSSSESFEFRTHLRSCSALLGMLLLGIPPRSWFPPSGSKRLPTVVLPQLVPAPPQLYPSLLRPFPSSMFHWDKLIEISASRHPSRATGTFSPRQPSSSPSSCPSLADRPACMSKWHHPASAPRWTHVSLLSPVFWASLPVWVLFLSWTPALSLLQLVNKAKELFWSPAGVSACGLNRFPKAWHWV